MKLKCTRCYLVFDEDLGETTETPGDRGCPNCGSWDTYVHDHMDDMLSDTDHLEDMIEHGDRYPQPTDYDEHGVRIDPE